MMNSLKLSSRHLKRFFFSQIPFSHNKTDNISEVLRSRKANGCASDARVLSARINSHLSNKATSIFIHRCVSGLLSRIFFFFFDVQASAKEISRRKQRAWKFRGGHPFVHFSGRQRRSLSSSGHAPGCP